MEYDEVMHPGLCFDKQGKPIDVLTWVNLFKSSDYRRVAKTVLPGKKLVSTVWIGLNHNCRGGEPLIFETMVFQEGSFDNLEMDRYSTLEEARMGHAAMVEKMAKKTQGLRL